MSVVIPYENIDWRVRDAIIERVTSLINNHEYFPQGAKNIAYRPLRPDDLNPTLTLDTREYTTVLTGPAAGAQNWTPLLNNPAAQIRVPSGNAFIIFGWLCIEDPTNPITERAMARIKVEGVIKQEVSLTPVKINRNHMLVLLDQIVKVGENGLIEIEIKDTGIPTGNTVEVLAYPLGYRVGPEGQVLVN